MKFQSDTIFKGLQGISGKDLLGNKVVVQIEWRMLGVVCVVACSVCADSQAGQTNYYYGFYTGGFRVGIFESIGDVRQLQSHICCGK